MILNHIIKGVGQGEALLLIHPLGAELSFWNDFVAILDGRIATIACDLRCSGKSPGAIAPPTLADHVEDLEALRRRLAVEKVIPIGCAIGSMVAAAYAGSYPLSTQALVMANPTPRSSPQAKKMLMERAATVLNEGVQAILPTAVDRAFVNQPRDERYQTYYRKFEAQDAQSYALSTRSAANADATEYLRAVQCPVLLVPGGHDVLLPIENTRAVQNVLPQAQFLVASNAAHFVPFQQPEFFAHAVLRFLGY